MTDLEFNALATWIKKEAKLAMAERTYQNDRAVGEVASKAQAAQREAYRLLVKP